MTTTKACLAHTFYYVVLRLNQGMSDMVSGGTHSSVSLAIADHWSLANVIECVGVVLKDFS